MTDVQSVPSVIDDLVAAFGSREFVLRESSAFPAVDGPLSAVTFIHPSEPDQPFVTVVVTSEGDLAVLDQATEAILSVHPDLITQPPLSVESFDAASAELPSPGTATSFEIASPSGPVGIAIVRTDRREAQGETADARPESTEEANVAPSQQTTTSGSARDLSLLGDVKLDVAVELGRQSVTLAHMLGLSVGAVIELDRAAGAPVDIRINGLLYGHGEVVVVDDQYAVRIIEILEHPEI